MVFEKSEYSARLAKCRDAMSERGIDVLVVNRDAPVYLLHNRAPERGSWLRVRVLTDAGADALGASVFAEVAGRRVRREVAAAYSYQASNDPTVHFGLGASERAAAVEVRWPDGHRRCFGERPAGELLVAKRNGGSPCAGE